MPFSESARATLAESIDDWLSVMTVNSSIPGISIAVADHEGVFCARAHGVSSLDDRELLQVATQFDVASHTKVTLLFAALLLQQEGCLDLHEPLRTYVPELCSEIPTELADATTYEVLTHRARFPRDYAPNSQKTDLASAIVEALEWSGLATGASYSNIAFDVLGSMIESVAAAPLSEHISRAVLQPLGLSSSSWWNGSPSEVPRAIPHGPKLDGVRRTLKTEPYPFIGAMGLWSTPSDLCTLVSALADNRSRLLTKESRSLALAAHWGPSKFTAQHEFALSLDLRMMAGRKWHGHTGGAPGFVTATYFSPETGVSFSVALNSRDVRVLEEVTESIAALTVLFEDSTESATQQTESIDGLYGNDLGRLQLLRAGNRWLLLDPMKWNLFKGGHDLRRVDDLEMRTIGNEFSIKNSRVQLVATDETVVGLYQGTMYFEKCSLRESTNVSHEL